MDMSYLYKPVMVTSLSIISFFCGIKIVMTFASEEFKYYTWYLKAISIVGYHSVRTRGTEQACYFFITMPIFLLFD